LCRADLTAVDLSGATLQSQEPEDRESLRLYGGADLRGTKLQGANLTGLYLSRARMTDADLRRAILKGTNLHAASMERVNLTDTDLTEANIRMAGLKDAKVGGARFPAGFDHAQHRTAIGSFTPSG